MAVPPAPRGLRPARHTPDSPLDRHGGGPGDPRRRARASTPRRSASAGASSRSPATSPSGSRASTRCPRRRSPPAAARRPLPLDAYGDYLLCAGRLERLKRVDLAIRALAARAARGAAEDRRARDRSRADLRRARRALGVATACDFLGFVPDDDLRGALRRAAGRASTCRVDEDYGYVPVESLPLAQARRHHDRRGRPARVRRGRSERHRARRRSRRRSREAIDRLFALATGRAARDGRARGTRAWRTSPGTRVVEALAGNAA